MERRLTGAGNASVAVCYHTPAAEIAGLPLLVTLHGGTYTSAYFAVLSVDRPGYGESTSLCGPIRWSRRPGRHPLPHRRTNRVP